MTTIQEPRPMAATTDAERYLTRRHGLLIGSERPPASNGQTFAVHDPASGRTVADVPRGGGADIDHAVATARAAFDDGGWRSLSAEMRT